MSAAVDATSPNTESPERQSVSFGGRKMTVKRQPLGLLRSGAPFFSAGLLLILVTQFAAHPLWHTDLWDHVQYGNHILNTGRINGAEPLLRLTDNSEMVNTAWGSQVLMALIMNSPELGPAALQFIYGLLIITAIGAVGMAVRRNSRSVTFGIAGYLIFLALNWQQFLVVRPQLAGVTFFSIVFSALATNADRCRATKHLLPVMFLLWVNLHGSFVMGLMITGLVAIGRWTDVFVRTRSWHAAFRFRGFRLLLVPTFFCVIATMVNPVGCNIYAEVLRVGSHPNITSMYEWAPLTLQMKQGQTAAGVSLALAIILVFTPRRVSATEWLPLIITGCLTLWSSRMINWFAPVAAYVLSIHAAAVWRRLTRTVKPKQALEPPTLWKAVIPGLFCVGMMLTPFGVQILHGKQPDLRTATSRQTPVDTARFLKTLPDEPGKMVFFPAEWAGFLTRFGQQHMDPMVNLHVHVIPPEIWSDYLKIASGSPESEPTLSRYHIDLVVLDRHRHGRLASRLLETRNFTIIYEDSLAAIFRRNGLRQ